LTFVFLLLKERYHDNQLMFGWN